MPNTTETTNGEFEILKQDKIGRVHTPEKRREMLSFSGGLKILVALEPCDMRKNFNGLQALVSETLKEDIKQGKLFVFTNRRHTRLKILYWDGSGLWLLAKKLEKGTFSWPKALEAGENKLKLRAEALAMLTDGIDLRQGKMRPWYEREN